MLLLLHLQCYYNPNYIIIIWINYENIDIKINADNFINKFKDIANSWKQSGRYVGYSGCRIDGLRSSFCGGYGSALNFCVSTEGLVSSCYEVLDENDYRTNLFAYGKYNRTTKSFEINEKKVKYLYNITVDRMSRCKDCFAKWNCGGHCIAKIALDSLDCILDDTPNYRCKINREIAKMELINIIRDWFPLNAKRRQ